MRFLLDTNTVSHYVRGVSSAVKHVQEQMPFSLAISSVTAMELFYGIEKRQSKTLTTSVLGFLSGVKVLPYDLNAAKKTGHIRAALERTGITLSLADCQIAGHALALELILVSNDAIFKRVSGLKVKDWSK